MSHARTAPEGCGVNGHDLECVGCGVKLYGAAWPEVCPHRRSNAVTTTAPALPPLMLADIIANPDRDDLRLLAADWCEDTGDEGRAEFIRVQVRIAALNAELQDDSDCGAADCGGCVERRPLWRRERELIDDHGFGWCDGLAGTDWKVHGCDKNDSTVGVNYAHRRSSSAHWHADITFRRGFPDSITLSAAAWVGTVCDRHTSNPPSRCRHCRGSGRLNSCGPAMVRAALLTRVTLSDVEPYENAAGCWIFVPPSCGTERMQRAVLSVELYGLLSGHLVAIPRVSCKAYRTRGAALDALSAAALAFARQPLARQG